MKLSAMVAFTSRPWGHGNERISTRMFYVLYATWRCQQSNRLSSEPRATPTCPGPTLAVARTSTMISCLEHVCTIYSAIDSPRQGPRPRRIKNFWEHGKSLSFVSYRLVVVFKTGQVFLTYKSKPSMPNMRQAVATPIVRAQNFSRCSIRQHAIRFARLLPLCQPVARTLAAPSALFCC